MGYKFWENMYNTKVMKMHTLAFIKLKIQYHFSYLVLFKYYTENIPKVHLFFTRIYYQQSHAFNVQYTFVYKLAEIELLM